MTNFGSSEISDGEEVDFELERQRAALDEQCDMYRGDNIDDLLPEELLGQNEFTKDEEDGTYKDGVLSAEEDNGSAGDTINDESTDDDENYDDLDDNSNDVATNFTAKSLRTDRTARPAGPAKGRDESANTGPHDGISESRYFQTPAAGWSRELEDERSNGRHQLESEDLPGDIQNLSVSQCIKRMYLNQIWHQPQARLRWQQHNKPDEPFREPDSDVVFVNDWECDEHVIVPRYYDHLTGPLFDLQQIDWQERTGVTPAEARRTRDSLYQNYHELKSCDGTNHQPCRETLTNTQFSPQAMHTKHQASTPHFQLRNHFAVQDHLRYIYSSGSAVWSEYNWNSERHKLIDFSSQPPFIKPVSISTLALSTDHPRSICMAGGLNGEFAYLSLLGDNDAIKSRKPSTGFISTQENGVVNHIDIDYQSNRQQHHAVISCNDTKVRTLDLSTGAFLHNPGKSNLKDGTKTGHTYPFAINASATCPDARLRVLVGDSASSLITNAATGAVEAALTGHSDYIFACAWSPDARQVVTAGQDRLVHVYDTRTWRILRTFSSHVSSHRAMKFSPAGGGPKCLLLAEEADRVTVVNAQTFEEAQTHTFYGSVVGVDFERDGSAFWVANGDREFGGFMRYERTGKGRRKGLRFTRHRDREEEDPDEWIEEEERKGASRYVNPRRHVEVEGWMA